MRRIQPGQRGPLGRAGSPPFSERFRDFRRAVTWHRRKLAVMVAVLAVLAGVNAAAPAPAERVAVLRAVTPLVGGAVITHNQVRIDQLPPEAVPDGALTAPEQAVGRTVAAPIPRGQSLSELDLVGQSSLTAGRVRAPVRLSDPGVSQLLRPGELIDIVGADSDTGAAVTVARGVRVVAIPVADETGSGRGSDEVAGLVLVEVDESTALALARASGAGSLTVVWR